MKKGTMIRLKDSTVERLKCIGVKADTYDSLINRLIDQHTPK